MYFLSAAVIFHGVTADFLFTRTAVFDCLHVCLVSGTGFGAFQAVDFALVMDVLPAEKDKAKDIAVWHLVRYQNIVAK